MAGWLIYAKLGLCCFKFRQFHSKLLNRNLTYVELYLYYTPCILIYILLSHYWGYFQFLKFSKAVKS